MAFAIETRTAKGGLKLEISAAIYALFNRIENYRAYRRTVIELSNLSDLELADLGLNRWTINSTALKAVYGSNA